MKNLILLLIAVLMSTTTKTGAQEVQVVYAEVGQTITLKAPDGLPSSNYLYWLLKIDDAKPLAWRNSLGGKQINEHWKDKLALNVDSLVIQNIRQEDFRKYVCKVTLNSGTHSTITYEVVKLTVRMNPPSHLLHGETLFLSCAVETRPGPEIHWLNPHGEKKYSQLTIRATSQDNGLWTCVVNNNNRAQVSVTVLDLSPAPSGPLYTSKARPLNVPCSLGPKITWEQLRAKNLTEVFWQFFPKPDSPPQTLFNLSLKDLTWKSDQNFGLRPVPDAKKQSLSLTTSRAKEENRGDYVCALKFPNGMTLKRTVHVEVLEITSSPGTEVVSGQQLNLTCSLGHRLPSGLRLKWIPPSGRSLPSLTPDRHPDHITIPEAGKGDGGKWSCELWQNGTRLTSTEITVKIEPKLSVWMLVVICSVAAIVILVLILSIILYRRRQRRMGHLRRQLCQCKTPKPKGFYRS
ncbi:CD4-1 molecule isoform X2 [Centropristis striata]|nr:CD4-1 molecule isoform X2 [Centropristis striata]XP_059195337.1 CD4-1 molecule isoform X2 [Centropristis striata]XP_059195338.1 CD4-1 molecule isoform X2 [Centropristis striata]